MHNTGSGEDAEQQSSGTECRIGEQVEEANEKKGEDVLHVIQMSSKKKRGKRKQLIIIIVFWVKFSKIFPAFRVTCIWFNRPLERK